MNPNRLSWIVFLLAVAVLVGCHISWIPQLPERIATHFDFAGKADGWSVRSMFFWPGLVIPFLICVPMLLISAFLPRLSPGMINVPRKDYWQQPQNYPRACAIISQWMRYFAAATLFFMTFLNRQVFLANLATPPRIPAEANTWLFVMPLLGVPLFIGWLVIQLARPPEKIGGSPPQQQPG